MRPGSGRVPGPGVGMGPVRRGRTGRTPVSVRDTGHTGASGWLLRVRVLRHRIDPQTRADGSPVRLLSLSLAQCAGGMGCRTHRDKPGSGFRSRPGGGCSAVQAGPPVHPVSPSVTAKPTRIADHAQRGQDRQVSLVEAGSSLPGATNSPCARRGPSGPVERRANRGDGARSLGSLRPSRPRAGLRASIAL